MLSSTSGAWQRMGLIRSEGEVVMEREVCPVPRTDVCTRDVGVVACAETHVQGSKVSVPLGGESRVSNKRWEALISALMLARHVLARLSTRCA